jgi:hypothetical protein
MQAGLRQVQARLGQVPLQARLGQVPLQARLGQVPLQALLGQVRLQALLGKVQGGKGQVPGAAPGSGRGLMLGHVVECPFCAHRHCLRHARPSVPSVTWVEELPRVEALARTLSRWLGCEKGRFCFAFVFAAWAVALEGGCRGPAWAGLPSSPIRKI